MKCLPLIIGTATDERKSLGYAGDCARRLHIDVERPSTEREEVGEAVARDIPQRDVGELGIERLRRRVVPVTIKPQARAHCAARIKSRHIIAAL